VPGSEGNGQGDNETVDRGPCRAGESARKRPKVKREKRTRNAFLICRRRPRRQSAMREELKEGNLGKRRPPSLTDNRKDQSDAANSDQREEELQLKKRETKQKFREGHPSQIAGSRRITSWMEVDSLRGGREEVKNGELEWPTRMKEERLPFLMGMY